MLRKVVTWRWFEKSAATELRVRVDPIANRLQPVGGTDYQLEREEDEVQPLVVKQWSKKRTRDYINEAFVRLGIELKQKRLLERQNHVLRTLLEESEREVRVLREYNEGLLEAVHSLDRLLEALLEAMDGATVALRSDCEALRRLLDRRPKQPLERWAAGVNANPRPKARWKNIALCLCSGSLLLCAVIHALPFCIEGPKFSHRYPPPV